MTRIRFYEQKGLLPEPKRGLGGQRNYSSEAVQRLEFISRFIEFEEDPSKGTAWLLERIDEYLQQVEVIREQTDKAEQYLLHLRAQFPKDVLSKRAKKEKKART